MKRFPSAIGGFLVVLLLLFSPGNGHAGPNANANILLHLLTPTTKNACTATPSCANIVTHGDLYPALYFAYVLVTDGNLAAGIAGLQFGIQYDGPGQSDGVGVDIYSWTLCATLEFITPSSPPWPNSGTGTLITWEPTTRCQRIEPSGAGTGVVADAGYFYCAAYTDAVFSIIPRPVDGQAKVASCAAEEDILQGIPSHLGSVGFGSRYGYSPCGQTRFPPACTILGPSSVVTGTTGHVYKLSSTPANPPTWTITGNGTLTSTSLDSAIVDAGAPGTFWVGAYWSFYESCIKEVTVEGPVPVLPTTWSGIKSLYREP